MMFYVYIRLLETRFPFHNFAINRVSIEFSFDFFVVKEFDTGKILVQGQSIDGVYEIPMSEPILKLNALMNVESKPTLKLGTIV